MMEKGKILAIDYGQKSIGLAVSDVGRTMAFGRGVIRNIPGEVGRQQVLLKLINLCKEDEVNLILLGMPWGENQQKTVQTERIEGFAISLREALQNAELFVAVEYIDESFSSYEANKILAKIGVPGTERKKTEDEMAAIVLIHRFIDFKP